MKNLKLFVFALISFLVMGFNVNAKTMTSEELMATASNGTVTLTENVELSNPISIKEGSDITIDLKGKVLSYTTSVAGEAMITNNGSLTITDSTAKADGKISFKYDGTPDSKYELGNYTILNNGTLVIKNGIVENTTDDMDHAFYTIDNLSDLTINGGKIVNTNNYAIRLNADASKKISAIINDGTIIGTRAIWIHIGSATTVKPDVSLNVTGGNLIGTGETTSSGVYKYAVTSYTYGNSLENVKINISGGVFEGYIALSTGNRTALSESEIVNITGGKLTDVFSYLEDEKTRIEITGGTFSNEEKYYENYVADGLVSKKVGDVYLVGKESTITVKDATNGEVKVDETTAVEGQIVTLTITAAKGYKLDKVVVKDADGKEVTVTDGKFVMPGSNVEVSATFVEDVPATPNVPKTNDNVMLFVALGFMSIAAIAVANNSLKKRTTR